jgi:hypothetical protein
MLGGEFIKFNLQAIAFRQGHIFGRTGPANKNWLSEVRALPELRRKRKWPLLIVLF